MSDNDNKLPSWLDNPEEEPENRHDEAGGDAPAEEPPRAGLPLPPWLQTGNLTPPEPEQPASGLPKLRRLQPPQEDESALPPWLRSAEPPGPPEPPKPRTYKIGGTELPEEYFEDVENIESGIPEGLTYDQWMAERYEEQRERDIEEEIPEDLFGVEDGAPDLGAAPPLAVTSQLPDWFLGLEELDTTEAPEWFGQSPDEMLAEPSAEPPAWMGQMMEDDAQPAADAADADDDIDDFFDSLGVAPQFEAGALPQTGGLDWFTPAGEDDPDATPDDDFFADLVGKQRYATQPEPPQRPEPAFEAASFDDDDASFADGTDDASFEDTWSDDLNMNTMTAGMVTRDLDAPLPDADALFGFDEDVFNAQQPAAQESGSAGGYVPEDELAAFLEGLEAPTLDDIEDPDLDFLSVDEPDEVPEQEAFVAAPASDDNDAMSWLSELDNIVTAVSRPAEPEPEIEFAQPDDDFGMSFDQPQVEPEYTSVLDDEPVPTFDQPTPVTRSDTFSWETYDGLDADAAAEPAPEDEQLNWLSAVPDDPEAISAMPDDDAPLIWESADEPPPPRQPSTLTGMLSRFRQSDDDDDGVQQMDEAEFFASLGLERIEEDDEQQPATAHEDDALLPDDELQSGWLDEDLLAEYEAVESLTAEASDQDDDFFTAFTTEASYEPGDDEDEIAEPDPSDALAFAFEDDSDSSEDDFFASLGVSDDEVDESGEPAFAFEDDAETSADDFFASIDVGEGMRDIDASQAPAFVLDDDELPEDDVFGSLGIENEQPAEPAFAFDDDADEQPAGDDLFAAFMGESAALDDGELASDEFFSAFALADGDESGEAGVSDEPDAWLSEIEAEPEAGAAFADDDGIPDDLFAAPVASAAGEDDEVDFDQLFGTQQTDDSSEDDFFAAAGAGAAVAAASVAQPETEFEDIDDYLASLSAEAPPVRPDTGQLMARQAEEIDLDALFADPAINEAPTMGQRPEVDPSEIEAAYAEDWLTALQGNVSEVSAGAMVRQREDRPVDELPERLRKLRERESEVEEKAAQPPPRRGRKTDTQETDALADIVPEAVEDGITPAPFLPGTLAFDHTLAMTAEQRARTEMLKSMVALTPAPKQRGAMSAIDMTYDSPLLEDFEGDEQTVVVTREAAAPVARPRRRARIRLRVDRLLIALVLVAAVVAPFYLLPVRFGALPASTFTVGQPAWVAFARVDTLRPGDRVLVAVEYSSTAAAELDPLTSAIVQHVLLRGATPVIVSTNPIGLLRAENILTELNANPAFLRRIDARQPLQNNFEYGAARFITAGVIGLRAFAADPGAALLTDIRGQASNLRINSLNDFALIALITDRAEDARAYAEQIAPLTTRGMIAAVSYGAAPLVEAYRGAAFDGLLVGYADGYTYNGLLDGVTAVRRGVRPTFAPPTPAPTVDPAGALADDPEATPEATAEPEADAAATAVPTRIAVVIAANNVNVRSGPSVNNAVVGTAAPGARLPVIGVNPAGDWINVRLPNGVEGWVSAGLVRLENAGASKPRAEGFAKPARQQIDDDDLPPTDTPTPRVTNTPRPTNTASPTAAATSADAADATPSNTPRPTNTPSRTLTPSITPTETPSLTPSPTLTPAPVIAESFSEGLRDERWYAFNFGILITAAVITLGMIINIVRGIFRRRGKR